MNFITTNPVTIERLAFGHQDKEYVEPHSLIMTFSECEYCGEKGHDKTYDVTFGSNFGIITCEKHIEKANKDIVTYAKNIGLLRINSEKLPDEHFTIKRTNGEMDDKWYPSIPNLDEEFCYLRKKDNEWLLPLRKDGLIKSVKINELVEYNPNKKGILSEFIMILNKTLENAKCKKDLYLS